MSSAQVPHVQEAGAGVVEVLELNLESSGEHAGMHRMHVELLLKLAPFAA